MDASEWSGPVGDAWAEQWRLTDRTFGPVDVALVDSATALVPADAGLRVLDIGCGAGATALSLAARLPAPRITGIDLSPALVAVAGRRGKEAGLTPEAPSGSGAATLDPAAAGANGWCAFLVADATRWAGTESFDLLVSRHGVMFFDDPAGAFAHLRSLAAPGAPLVFSCFRAPALNPWASEPRRLLDMPPGDPLAPGPFAFADRDRVAGLLAVAGFRDAHAEPLDYDYVVGEGPDAIADTAAFFLRIGPMAAALRAIAEADRPHFVERLATIAGRYHRDDRVAFPAAAWIWTARA